MKKLLALLMCAVLLTSMLSIAGLMTAGAAAPTGDTHDPDIISGNNYSKYTSVTRTYLCPVQGGYMRVYGIDNGTLLAEYYDNDFNYISGRYVESGLKLFGGFIDSGGSYFVVTGQTNKEEDDGKEVIRITRFNHNWEPIAQDSLYGGNTTVPFDAGRCALAAYDSRLVIRTGHEIYKIDGNNHQCNMTLVVDKKRTKIVESFFGVGNTDTAGFLSHSFNQYVDIDSYGTVVCLDHGDAHPREAVLGRFKTKADELVIYDNRRVTYEHTSVMNYVGSAGDNITGAMLGGLSISSSSYLTVGTAVEQNENYRQNRAYNAYLSVTDKNVASLADAETRLEYFTNFTEEDGRYATNPKLVKFNSDLFLVMWNEVPVTNYVVGQPTVYDSNYQMSCVFVDGQGNRLSDILTPARELNAFVTECDPIVSGNRAIWYVSDGADISNIITLEYGGGFTAYENVVPESLNSYPIDISKLRVAFRSFEPIPEGAEITEDNLDDYVVVCYKGRMLERGKDYLLSNTAAAPFTVSYSNGSVSNISLKLTASEGYTFYPLAYSYYWGVDNFNTYLMTPTQEDDGVHMKVYAGRGVGYHVYRKDLSAGGDFELIGTVTDRRDDVYIDSSLPHDGTYSYMLREYTFDKDGNEILANPSSTRTINVTGIIPPTEPPTEPPFETAVLMLGDADGDQNVTVIDATYIQMLSAGKKRENELSPGADADLSGGLSVSDATEIQRYLAKLGSAYPIGTWQEIRV